MAARTKTYFDLDILPLPEFLREYFNYCVVVRNLAAHSIKTYYVQISKFCRWAHAKRQGKSVYEVVDAVDIADVELEDIAVLTEQDIYAYLAFTAIASDMQIQADDTQYDIYTVSDSFQGTLSSKSGSHGYNDTIEIYVPKGEHPISVRYSDGTETSGSIYQKDFLNTKDKYALFLGGNHPIVTITTTADTDRTLMLIKDSYANCFAQFLTPYFDQIIIVDPRYCYDSVDMLINQYEITDLLYLYNADTFMTDTSLTDFLTLESDNSEQSKE